MWATIKKYATIAFGIARRVLRFWKKRNPPAVAVLAVLLLAGTASAEEKPVLRLFSAADCTPCFHLKQRILATDLSDVDFRLYDAPSIAEGSQNAFFRASDVTSFPTMILYTKHADGKWYEVGRHVGGGIDVRKWVDRRLSGVCQGQSCSGSASCGAGGSCSSCSTCTFGATYCPSCNRR